MKTMNCKQLGGACNVEFHAETFDEIANQSKNHGARMMEMGEGDHMKAMEKMKTLMSNPNAMQQWMNEKRNEFEALPEVQN